MAAANVVNLLQTGHVLCQKCAGICRAGRHVPKIISKLRAGRAILWGAHCGKIRLNFGGNTEERKDAIGVMTRETTDEKAVSCQSPREWAVGKEPRAKQ